MIYIFDKLKYTATFIKAEKINSGKMSETVKLLESFNFRKADKKTNSLF